MRSLISCSFLIASVITTASYAQINSTLKLELDSIYTVDQLYREILAKPLKKDSLSKAQGYNSGEVQNRIFTKLRVVDASNMKKIEAIISQHGYPGKSLVGEPTNEAAWYVIQHSQRIEHYFPLIEEAGKKNELPFTLVAKMQDRLLVQQGREQLYGTQGQCDVPKGTATASQKPDCYIWPIADPAHVNERRKQAGFTDTVEAYAKSMGVEYQPRALPK